MSNAAPVAVPRRTRLDRDERREQILACARSLFSERHYSAVSMADIADAAGVARGLLHHYFGTKRELYVEVVREMVRLPPPLAEENDNRPLEEIVSENVDLWLEMVERNHGTWLAAIGAEGFGRDRELERVLDEAREAMAERVIQVLRLDGEGAGGGDARAMIRAYGGMAEAATREWLERGRLSRRQVHILLSETLLSMAREHLPRLHRARDGSKGA